MNVVPTSKRSSAARHAQWTRVLPCPALPGLLALRLQVGRGDVDSRRVEREHRRLLRLDGARAYDSYDWPLLEVEQSRMMGERASRRRSCAAGGLVQLNPDSPSRSPETLPLLEQRRERRSPLLW